MIYDLKTASRRRGPAWRHARALKQRRAGIGTLLLLAVILLIGLGFRVFGLADWDQRQFLHPDERFVAYAVSNLQLPRSLRDYFDSATAPLNPRNYEWSRLFVYGTLPTTLTRVAAAVVNRPGATELVIVGRALSAFFDLVACAALFFLGRRIYDRRVGLLAAALYAVAVMPIQQAHFFTTDNFAVAFATLALVAAVRLGLDGRWRDAAWAGLWTGAAVASKINLAALAPIIALAALQAQFTARSGAERLPRLLGRSPLPWIRSALLLALAGLVTFVSFRVFQPDAFTGPNIWNIWPEPRFLDNLETVRGLVDGSVDMPPAHQWANRPPYLFALQNMVVWGMGLPLGLAAWTGFAAAGWRLLRPKPGQTLARRWAPLVPWAWVALYFAWQGRGFNPSMRYFLPIYPALLLFAAWSSLELGGWLRARMLSRRWRVAVSTRRLLAGGLLPGLLLLAATASWAWAFSRIYARPHTRIAAGQWMLENAPVGSRITTERWDDALPYTNGNDLGCRPFCLVETLPYDEDEPAKYFGRMQPTSDRNYPPAQEQFVEGLIGQLGRADYVVLSSARVYSSVARLPHRFPATLRYYQALFDGSLGYQLVADFHSFPTLFGLPIPDLSAEEQFTVYDHPRVLIFRRTETFNPDAARAIITDDVNWDEIYKISALTTSSAPTALRLTERKWNLLQQSDARYLFDSSLGGAGPLGLILALLTWLLAIELLGLAALGLIWRFRLPLPDRGVLSARPLGLVAFALPPALIAASGRLAASRLLLAVWFGLLLGFGLRMLIVERAAIRAFVRANLRQTLAAQALYLLVVLFGLATVRGADAAGSDAFGLAQWAALLRSPVLPPPDPLFAGGQMVAPYAALVPVAALARLIGGAPSFAWTLALATLGGLLVSAVWSATVTRRRSLAFVPFLAALLALAPGLSGGANAGQALALTPLGALTTGYLGVLAAAALAALILAAARGIAADMGGPARPRLGTICLLAVAATLLGLLRAHDRWAFIAVLVPSGLFVGAGFARQKRMAHGFVAPLGMLALALLLAQPLTVVASPAAETAGLTLSARTLLPALALAGAGIAAFIAAVGARLADRTIAAVAGGLLAGWLVVGSMLNWALWMTLAPVALVLVWLLTEALLLRRRGRWPALVLLPALIAVGLLPLAELRLLGRAAGDPRLVIAVAVVLLACAAGWALPALDLLGRRRRTRAAVFLGGLVLGALVVVGVETLRPASAAPTPASSGVPVEIQGAIAALAADAEGAPVVAVAPMARVPAAISATGLPALLAAEDVEARLRAILRPSFDSVAAARSRALTEIYGADPVRVATQLRSYAVEYVVLGPDERALYGPSAGAALGELVTQGMLVPIYDQDGVAIYRRDSAGDTPPYVARAVKLDVPSLKDGLLDQPLAELPVVNEYGWNRWATGNPWLAILVWLLLFEALGLLAWPLAGRIFPRSADAGWAWSKLVGLLIWGYAIWLPVSLGWWSYRWAALLIGAAALGGLSWIASGRPTGRAGWRSALRPADGWPGARRDILRSEALFLVAFMLWTLVRAANPDLWHPTHGGEKPFEFGMLNAIMRSPVMPPPDPFFSGGVLNYYYYGLFLVSAPIRATGIDPAVAFNLIVPTLFALVVVTSAAVVRELTRSWRWALFGVVMVTLIGPVASVFSINGSRGLMAALATLRDGFGGWGGRIGDWFWGPSRVIPFTINEFPFFSFLFADLHPHMIALPVTILAVALALELGRTERRRGLLPLLWLGALVIGTLAAANSWDAPTAALLIGGTLVGRAWRLAPSGGWQGRWRGIGGAAASSVALLAGGLLLFLPFFMNYQAMVGGIGRVRKGDTVLQFAAIFGPSLYIALTLLVGLAWVVGQRAPRPFWRYAARGGAIALPLLAVALLLGGAAFGAGQAVQDAPAAGFPALALLLAALVVLGLLLAFVARLRDEQWMILWIVTVALMVALGVQIVFVRDHLAGGDYERMNTVFKFGLQTWTLLAIGASAALPLVLRMLRRAGELPVAVWSAGLLLLLFGGLTYPVVATPSRLALRFSVTPGVTLDGLAYMDTATYEHDGKRIEMQWDAEAIRWLKANLVGLPIVLQSEAEFYRAYGVRIAASTGFPTVISGLHEDEQRPGALVRERIEDVREIYSTPDPRTALRLLHKYRVEYVYVGPAERNYYDAAGLPKWEELAGTALDVVYENPGVRIYRLRPGQEPPPETVQPPSLPPLPIDSTLQELETQQQAQPGNAEAAFSLATQYVQAGRLADAADVLTAAAAANPQDVPLHQFLGDIQAQLGRADEAITAWQAAVNFAPTAGNISKLATGLTLLGRYDEAERTLDDARQRDPNDPLINFYLAENARKRNGPNDPDLARREYQTYLERSPADSPFRGVAEQALQQLAQ